jgi:hypothetical protein
MSDLVQLEELRLAVEELRGQVAALAARPQAEPEKKEGDEFSRYLRDGMVRAGKTWGIAVSRAVGLIDGRGTSGGFSGRMSFYSPNDLPSDEQVGGYAAKLGMNPVAFRALRYVVARCLEGEPMRATTSELTTALAVDEDGLQEALRPFVALEWLQWSKTAEGEEFYDWLMNDQSLILLTLLHARSSPPRGTGR